MEYWNDGIWVQKGCFTTEAQRTRRRHFLFGGRCRQTKRIPVYAKHVFHPVSELIRGVCDSDREAMEPMIQSSPPDWIIKHLSLCSQWLRGEPDFERRNYQSKSPMKSKFISINSISGCFPIIPLFHYSNALCFIISCLARISSVRILSLKASFRLVSSMLRAASVLPSHRLQR
jgi:hypothetical protein